MSRFEEKHSCDDRRDERACRYFKSIAILDHKIQNRLDNVHHDLQSFYWLLTWLVLRYTTHSLGPDYCYKLFPYGADDQTAADLKTHWVFPFAWSTGKRQIDFEVRDNAPLTALVEDFRLLIQKSRFDPMAAPPVPLAYESVLGIFRTAVESPGWPASDFVPCTVTRRRETEKEEEDSVVSAPCGENVVIVSEGPYDSDVRLEMMCDLTEDEDEGEDSAADTNAADPTCDLNDPVDDTNPPENLSARTHPALPRPADNASDDAAGGSGSQQQPQGMTTRLRAKRNAGAAVLGPSRSDKSSKRLKTAKSQAPIARNARESGSRGKKAPTTRRAPECGGRW